MPQGLIDLDQVPQQFGCSLFQVYKLIRHGKIHPIPAERRVLRQSRAKTFFATHHIRQVSRAEVDRALKEHQEDIWQGKGLSNNEMARKLGISLTGWLSLKRRCDPLGGIPIEPIGHGRRRGHEAPLFDPKVAESILTVFRDAKEGRVVINGVALLSTTRALDRLRQANADCCDKTLHDYRTHGGWALGNQKLVADQLRLHPGKGVSEYWWDEGQIERLASILAALKEGRYISEDGRTVYLRRGAARLADCTIRTIKEWEYHGLLKGTPVPVGHNQRRKTPAFTKLAIADAKRMAQRLAQGQHEPGSRVNVACVAKALNLSRGYTLELIEKCSTDADRSEAEELLRNPDKPTTKALLGHNPKTRRRGNRPEHTILLTGIPLLLAQRQRELKAGKVLGWKDASELTQMFGLDRGGEIKTMKRALVRMRELDPECCTPLARELHGVLHRRWGYDACRIERMLNGKTFAEFLAAHEGHERTSDATRPTRYSLLTVLAKQAQPVPSAARITTTLREQEGPALDTRSRPRWDSERRELWFADKLCKGYYANPAKNQIDVIEAFEVANWPATIPDPFRNSRKLNVTIACLNKNMPTGTIRFRGDGTGEGVNWHHPN